MGGERALGWCAAGITLAAGLALGAAAAAAEPVKLVTGNGYEPLADSQLPDGGMSTAVVKAAYDAVGRETSVSFRPWKRGYMETRAGRFDATFPYTRTEKRAAEMVYSDPIYTVRSKPFVRAHGEVDAADLAGLAGTAYCMPRGYDPPPPIKCMTRRGELSRVKANDLGGCMEMLAAGQSGRGVTFVPMDTGIGRAEAADALADPSRIAPLDITITERPLHLIVPRGREDAARAVRRFNAGLAEIRENGTYARIRKRFLE